jgi:formylglycine-generating enzyme required for sulfatase activity
VTIGRDFYLGATEVTQGQYETVMGSNPAYFAAQGPGAEKVREAKLRNLPVERVSYDDALEFCRRLAAREGKAPGAYRLPTEAEWEYAARAGGPAPAAAPAVEEVAWFVKNSAGRPHEVATRPRSALGLHDMLGNVAEWCSDWYDEGYYATGPSADPPGPEQPPAKQRRVLRGGSWLDGAGYCRPADRNFAAPSSRENCYGFRVVAVVP